MRRVAIGLIGILLAGGLVIAQAAKTTGTLTANGQCVMLAVENTGTTGVELSGTWVGTIIVEGSARLTSPPWNRLILLRASAAPTDSTTTNGLYQVSTAGLARVRACTAAYTSGTVAVALTSSTVAVAPGTQMIAGQGTGGTVVVPSVINTGSASPLDYGLVVHVGAMPTVAVTGPLTNTQLRATPVPVSGALTDAELRASTLGVTVSNFPVSQSMSGTVSVTNFPATQSVSGTVTANAGTNLNTSALALEAGHLAAIDTSTARIPPVGQAAVGASLPVVLPAAQITSLTPPAAITGFALNATLTGGLQTTRVTDGTNTATIKAATTAASASDTALVVAVSPTTPVAVTGAFFQTTQPISGAVSVSNFPATQPVSLATLPALSAGSAVIGHVITDTGSTTAVTGTVAVSGTVTTTPPANASTNVAQFGGSAVVTGIGVSGVGIPRITVSNDSVVALAASTAVIGHIICDSGCSAGSPGQATMAASAPVVIASNQSAVPVTLTSTTVTGNVTVVQGTGTNLHVVVDTAPTTAVTAAALPLPTGAATETTLAALNTKVTAVNTGAVTIASALPAGANAIGATLIAQTARTAGTLTSTTCPGTGCVSVATPGYGVATVTMGGTYSLTPVFEFSDDSGTTYYAMSCTRTDAAVQESSPGALVNTVRAWDCSVYSTTNFRVRASAFVSGTATVGITLSAAHVEAAPTVSLAAVSRTAITLTADAVTPAATDTLVTVAKLVGDTATAGVTTYAVTSGKTLRISSINLSFTSSTTTANKVRVRLRTLSSGACIASSPLVGTWEIALPPGTLAANQGTTSLSVPLPDGLEFTGATRNICFSAIAAAANGTLTITLIGYEY